MSHFDIKPSVLGFIFEMTMPAVVLKLFAMSVEERKEAFGSNVWGFQNLNVLQSKSVLFQPYCRQESAYYTLKNHLTNPRCCLLSLGEERGADFASSLTNDEKITGLVTVQTKFQKSIHQDEAFAKSTLKPFVLNPRQVQIRILVSYPKVSKFKLCTVQGNLITLIIDQRNFGHFFTNDEIHVFHDMKQKGFLDHLEHFESVCTEYELE
jgi:hypothetical protein